MGQLFDEPCSFVLALTFGVAALGLVARAGRIYRRSRGSRAPGPMLLPIRAWRHLILGIAGGIATMGFAIGQPWLVVFALVLGFVEGLESTMMVAALAGEDWDSPLEPASRRTGP